VGETWKDVAVRHLYHFALKKEIRMCQEEIMIREDERRRNMRIMCGMRRPPTRFKPLGPPVFKVDPKLAKDFARVATLTRREDSVGGFKVHPKSSLGLTVHFSSELKENARALLSLSNKISTKLCEDAKRAYIPYVRKPDAKELKSLSKDLGSSSKWTVSYLKQAVQRYKMFLNLLNKTGESTVLIPTLEIEALWVTHLLRPGRYRSDCLRAFGACLDHRIRATSNENALDFGIALERTKELWLKTYGFPYIDDSKHKSTTIPSKTMTRDISMRFENTINLENGMIFFKYFFLSHTLSLVTHSLTHSLTRINTHTHTHTHTSLNHHTGIYAHVHRITDKNIRVIDSITSSSNSGCVVLRARNAREVVTKTTGPKDIIKSVRGPFASSRSSLDLKAELKKTTGSCISLFTYFEECIQTTRQKQSYDKHVGYITKVTSILNKVSQTRVQPTILIPGDTLVVLSEKKKMFGLKVQGRNKTKISILNQRVAELLSCHVSQTNIELSSQGLTHSCDLMYSNLNSSSYSAEKMNDAAKKAISSIQISVDLVESMFLDSHWLEDYLRTVSSSCRLPNDVEKFLVFISKRERRLLPSSKEKRLWENKALTKDQFVSLGQEVQWKFAPIANGYVENLKEIETCRTFLENREGAQLAGSCKGYEKFLYLLAKNGPGVPDELTHPSVCIDLIYHTHMIHPLAYHDDTMRLLGWMPDHDPWPTDTKTGTWISDSDMSLSCQTMSKAWQEEFGTRLDREHCLVPVSLGEIANSDEEEKEKKKE